MILVEELAQFRYRLRRFLRFSEKAARASGVTPHQHQLMLGVAGFTGRGWATISELREFLQERHNAVVALVSRAVRSRLVRKTPVARDRRFVRVDLTPAGRAALTELSALHRKELARFHDGSDGALFPRLTGERKRASEEQRREPSAKKIR
ncbi:MAG: MarR family transcriptional regulator [Candidatus Acidiferrales bacterium]